MSICTKLREWRRPGESVAAHRDSGEPESVWSKPELRFDPLQNPLNRQEVYSRFGDPTDENGEACKKWLRKNMVVAKGLPGTWNKGKGKLYVNRFTEPKLLHALIMCDDAGVLGYIERMGCYCYRRQRHRRDMPLSYHSWGLAIDINPAQNRVKSVDQGDSWLVPWATNWYETYPHGVPRDLVKAFRTAGFVWGGEWTSFKDPMHFQLVGRP